MTSQSTCESEPEGAEATAEAAAGTFCTRHGREMWLHEANGWTCDECRMERDAAVSHQEFHTKRAREDAARKQDELSRRLGAACIPARFQSLTFDGFPAVTADQCRARDLMRAYANRFAQSRKDGVSALLVGGTGTGKTGLALCVANTIVADQGRTAVFMTAYGAVRHQRDTWGRKGRTEREALDDLLEPDLLVLDDVGASVGTAVEMAMLFEVINGRYGEKKPTLLTSNLPLNDTDRGGSKLPGLRTMLGSRIIDRFNDDGSFVVTFSWPSLRGARP